MQRRNLVLAGSAAVLMPAWAHHGWSSFDTDRPIYLEGRVDAVMWRNPHAEFVLEVTPGLKLPADLAQRSVPAQSTSIDGKALLARATVPDRADRRWQIELAPLTRLRAWNMPEIKPGDTVSLLGYTFAQERGDPVLRAEYVFLGNRAYGLRSSPA